METNLPDHTRQHLAVISAFSCLVSELTKSGVINLADLVQNIQTTAIAHRARGNDDMAIRLHGISEHLLKTARDPAG